MKLQNLLFPQTGICTEESMYFRRKGVIDFTWDKNFIGMSRNSSISFDTYFNGCSAEKWFKYTKIKKIRIVIHAKGKFRITLMRKEKYLNGNDTKFLHEETFGEEGQEGVYTFPFDTESNSGMFCFSILCLSNSGTLLDGYYDGEVDEIDVSSVKLALVICTFKREAFVTKNVRLLNDYILSNQQSAMNGHLEIFISDNAGTLNQDDVLLNDNIHIFLNKNTGGAGGFTRGMIEVLKCREQHKITHVLVMDDDVIINPDSIYRTFNILSLLKDEYKDAFVGGAMLRLDKQYIQTEAGARWNKGYLISHKSGLNLLDVDACLYNEFEEKTEFNAWWYCAFPVDVISDSNLPLPIFIRGDDVEYGLRNMKRLILMNGICVWHEPFENKYSSSMYYYIFRNRLIDNSIHSMKYKRKHFVKDLKEQVFREIAYYRYKNADLLMDGVNDFFNGIDWFKSQDGAALHKDIMNRGYKLQDINTLDVPFSYPAYEQSCRMEDFKGMKNFVRKITGNGLLLPAKKKQDNEMPVVAPTFTARPVNFYRVKKALNYDYCSRKGFVTEKSFSETFRLLWKFEKIAIKSRYKYRKTVKQYQERGKELMQLSFWNNYLDI
ncbi:MAG: glycosyltransferase family 2 protein [Acutalibacteraceae bacterium]